MLSVGVPVMLDGQVKYALTLSLSPGSLQQLLAQGAIAADSLATIIDGNKSIVARSQELENFFGKPADPIVFAHTAESPEGWRFVPRQHSGGVESSYAAHRRSEFSGWTVVIGVPTAKVNALFWQALQFIGGGIVVLLGVALGLAAVFGRRIISSITALAAGAKALGSRDTVSIVPSAIFEIDQVRQAIGAKTLSFILHRRSSTRFSLNCRSAPCCFIVPRSLQNKAYPSLRKERSWHRSMWTVSAHARS